VTAIIGNAATIPRKPFDRASASKEDNEDEEYKLITEEEPKGGPETRSISSGHAISKEHQGLET